MLAHELSHVMLTRQLDNFSAEALSKHNDAFTGLLVRIYNSVPKDLLDDIKLGSDDVRDFLIELFCDLLATSIRGTSYIYAVFLEIFGLDIEHHFAGYSEYINLEQLQAKLLLEEFTVCSADLDWYLRLKILCQWYPFIKVRNERDVLSDCTIRGISSLCDQFLHGIQKKSTFGDLQENTNFEDNWIIVLTKIQEALIGSKFTKIIFEWRQKREAGYKNAQFRDLIYDNYDLDNETREGLYKVFFHMKTQRPNKPLSKYSGQVIQKKTIQDFEEFYFTRKYGTIIKGYDGAYKVRKLIPFLFSTIYDIPYQASILRAKDFINSFEYVSLDEKYCYLHDDMSPGHELFQIALEINYHNIQQSLYKFSTITKLIADVLKSLNSNSEEYEILCKWLGSDNDNGVENDYQINDKNNYNNSRHEIRENSPQYSAYRILRYYQKNIIEVKNLKNSRHLYRYLETLMRWKLISLVDAVNRIGGCGIRENILMFDSLEHNLSVNPAKNSLSLAASKALNGIIQTDKSQFGLQAESLLIERISVLGARFPNESIVDKTEQNESIFDATEPYKCLETDGGRSYYIPTMGGFDIIKISERCHARDRKMPILQNKNGEKIYVPHFIRREYGIRYNLYDDKVQSLDDVKFNRCIGFVSILLNHRSVRLEFLKNLKQIINKECDFFSKDSFAIIGEGWGDVILVMFSNESDGKRNHFEDLFDLQQKIYNLFIVERTETIFTTSNFFSTLKQKKYSEMTITIRLRLKSNINSQTIISEFEEEISKILKKHSNKQKDIRVSQIPGRFDYEFVFININNNTGKIIKDLFKLRYIDDFASTIGRRIRDITT